MVHNNVSGQTGVIFRAIPDSGTIFMRPNGKGNVQPIWPNCTVIPNKIYEKLYKSAPTLWHPAPSLMNLSRVSWAVNMCADADEYSEALAWLTKKIFEGNVKAVFNHPIEIGKTRRDLISEILSGIENLIVPQCVRFEATHSDQFFDIFEKNNFSYPVIIRVSTSQGGRDMVKINHTNDWSKIFTIPWGGRHVYMTQFVDFIGDNNDYTKIRLTFIGNEFLVRHAHFGKEWKVHYSAPSENKVKRELALIDNLNSSQKLKSIATKIQEAVRLDYWGIDIGYVSERQDFIFFEGNAAMSMVPNIDSKRKRSTSELKARDKKRYIGRTVAKKLDALLFSPQYWKSNILAQIK